MEESIPQESEVYTSLSPLWQTYITETSADPVNQHFLLQPFGKNDWFKILKFYLKNLLQKEKVFFYAPIPSCFLKKAEVQI